MIQVYHDNNKILLYKDGNIHLRIDGPDQNAYKVVFYAVEDSDGSLNGECIYSPPIHYPGWSSYESLDHTSDKYPNKILISIVSGMTWFLDLIYDKQQNKFYRINTTKNEKILNDVSNPIIITGAPGGGTSYITKLLKYRGFYCGTDSGNFNVRKNHESVTFTSVKNIACFDRDHFLWWTSEKEILQLKQNVKDRLNFYSLIIKNQLEYKFENFWGNKPTDSVWGWKDPSASIFLPIWRNIFPLCRLMIIQRNNDKLSENVTDDEGEWFRKNNELLNHFYKPDLTDFSDSDVFRCDFNKVVTDFNETNKMLKWFGLDELKNKDELIDLLTKTGYEGKINNAS